MKSKEARVRKLEQQLGKADTLQVAYIDVTPEGGTWYDRPLSDPDKRELTEKEKQEVAAGVNNITVKYIDNWREMES